MEVIFEKKNKKSAQSKMRRLVGNSSYGTIGFTNFTLVKVPHRKEEPEYCFHYGYFDWAIKAYSTYHAETTIRNMYKSNGKKW